MDADIWVARLTYEQAAIVWPKAEPLLRPAIEHSELWLSEDVRERVTTPGSWCLWIAADKDTLIGAWVTAPMHFPRHAVLEIVFGGGPGVDRYYDLGLAELEKFAREIGCCRLRAYGRLGWARKRGFRAVGHITERILE